MSFDEWLDANYDDLDGLDEIDKMRAARNAAINWALHTEKIESDE